MTEEIKDLIEKIHQEGIKAGEEKAKVLEDEAKQKAQAIIAQAYKEAERIIAEGKEKASHTEKDTRVLLEQAGRNLLLSLRGEVNAMLKRLILGRVREGLAVEKLSKIIAGLIKDLSHGEKTGMVISLNKDDLEKLEKTLFHELGEEAKRGIILKAQEDIEGGFLLSYDGGKSHFDFTDQALAEYIGTYLNPKLKAILNQTTLQEKKPKSANT